MVCIADTILKTAEELAQLHDVMILTYTDAQILNSATQIGKASDILIDDITYELSKRQFPVLSRIKNLRAPLGNAALLLSEVQNQTFTLPNDIDKQVKMALDSTEKYYADKKSNIEILLSIPEDATNYFLTIAANRSSA